jgi:uncharacterized protein YjeT (DUF2065 family)
MSERLWGLALVLIGAVIAWDGWRLWQDERAESMFDPLGPDRYIILMGGLLILTGTVILLSRPASTASAARVDMGERYRIPVAFMIVLAAYALLIPLLGHTGATFLFFLAAFFLAGRRNLMATLLTSTVSATIFYVLFPYFADMPLPRGILGF